MRQAHLAPTNAGFQTETLPMEVIVVVGLVGLALYACFKKLLDSLEGPKRRKLANLEDMRRNPNASWRICLGEYLDTTGFNVYVISPKRVSISCKNDSKLRISLWSDFRRSMPYGVAGSYGGGGYHSTVLDAWRQGKKLLRDMQKSPLYIAEREAVQAVRAAEIADAPKKEKEKGAKSLAKGITRPGTSTTSRGNEQPRS